MRRFLRPAPLLLAMLAFVLGCASAGGASKRVDTEAATTIDIQNGDFSDMTVYVLVNGQRTRLGIARGNKTTVLTIPRYLIAGTTYLRFLADPIGGNRSPVSEAIDVSTGDQLVMIINPGG
ncbi:MAG: hypothetical protein H0U66_15210 [Gemmatimonadaceae bacterium]|nr:hypothetical protein [Gemmatimonadaceae bacterium]